MVVVVSGVSMVVVFSVEVLVVGVSMVVVCSVIILIIIINYTCTAPFITRNAA